MNINSYIDFSEFREGLSAIIEEFVKCLKNGLVYYF